MLFLVAAECQCAAQEAEDAEMVGEGLGLKVMSSGLGAFSRKNLCLVR